MTVKYHIETPDGVVTRTTKGATIPRYSHIVIYDGHIDVPGGRKPGGKIPSFHGNRGLAESAAVAWGGKHIIYPIEETDYTVTGA